MNKVSRPFVNVVFIFITNMGIKSLQKIMLYLKKDYYVFKLISKQEARINY